MLLAAAGADAAVKPSLHVITLRPQVVVNGSGFQPSERVQLKLMGHTSSAVAVAASSTGTFRVSLKRPVTLPCGRLVLRAAGSKGSVAVAHIGPAECNPPAINTQ